jgi:hypothetical protein
MANLVVTKGNKSGAVSGCPYCRASENPWPPEGTSLVFLKGIDAGQSGVVVKDSWGTCPSDRFLVKMEYEKTRALRMVMPSHELYLDSKLFVVPAWMPPISIEDNALLHECLLGSLDKITAAHGRSMVGNSLLGIIATCWWQRLPLDGADIWPMLDAHGVASNLKADFIEFFEFGVSLLTAIQGRPAVKRKRMRAMSQGRYLTKGRRELRLKKFGHC